MTTDGRMWRKYSGIIKNWYFACCFSVVLDNAHNQQPTRILSAISEIVEARYTVCWNRSFVKTEIKCSYKSGGIRHYYFNWLWIVIYIKFMRYRITIGSIHPFSLPIRFLVSFSISFLPFNENIITWLNSNDGRFVLWIENGVVISHSTIILIHYSQ